MSRQANEEDDGMLRKKAHECVEYVLFCVLAERKPVVRKTELNKNVIKEHSRHFKAILNLTRQYLRDVFGVQLIDLDPSEKGERFGVRSKFEYDSELNKSVERAAQSSSKAETDREFDDQFRYSMLMIALSLIFMNGNEMEVELFWDSLKKVDIQRDEKRHKYLGDVNKFFTNEMVKEGYLEYEQMAGIEPPAYKFKWGYRSKLEITKRSVLDFVCQVYGGRDVCKPADWLNQFADAKKRDMFNNVDDEDEDGGNNSNDENNQQQSDAAGSQNVSVANSQTRASSSRKFKNVAPFFYRRLPPPLSLECNDAIKLSGQDEILPIAPICTFLLFFNYLISSQFLL